MSTPPNPRIERRSIGFALGAGLICALALLTAPALARAATVDLGVAQADNPDPARNGEPLTYTVTVANAGPDAAHKVRLVDTLSPRVDFVGANSPRASCARHGRRVVCAMGTIAAGQSETVNIRVRPAFDRERYPIHNVASVGKRKTDSRPANNTTTERTTIVNPPPVICAGQVATIVGTDGDDALFGTDAPDVIALLSGNDEVVGLGGNDVVCASGGRDKVRGSGGDDRIKGGGGRDKLRGGDGDDRLQGKSDRDKLRGGRGNDVLRGGHGDDRCRGGGGADIRRSC